MKGNAPQKVLIHQMVCAAGELTLFLGFMALYKHGVDHREVTIGNVFLGTDPSKPTGFIADFDLSSISDKAIKAAYPTEYGAIVSKLKHGEWHAVHVSQFDFTTLFLIGHYLGYNAFHVSGFSIASP